MPKLVKQGVLQLFLIVEKVCIEVYTVGIPDGESVAHPCGTLGSPRLLSILPTPYLLISKFTLLHNLFGDFVVLLGRQKGYASCGISINCSV
jgi:hypothetical protein